MSRVLFILAVVATVATVISAQCAATDNVNCASWVKNGFCNNPGYTEAYRQQYCPNSCTNSGCGAAGATTTTAATPAKENANCPKWNEDPTNAFCASQSAANIKTFCFTTCAKEITPVDGCAFYVDTAGKVVRTGANKTAANDDTVVPTLATATNKILYAYAKTGCTVAFYAAATSPATPPGLAPDLVGAGTITKVTVAAQQTAAGITCKCTA
ncbi:hypothetical protein PENTCL1PPCAC_176 [Pristionchus entomophagus]|uniref:ShKT domain-containing protein n=1 Tax=Pristionchus entomophagus TaxID=358040 RepID=A0AAV5S5Z4_9BILA|nr:hypothetical protein PENTCL1PPCAC_176 [Pristionchus entomophagus]